MLKIGDFNSLRIVKEVDFGVYLDGETEGEILMPQKYVPKDAKINDIVEVFVYSDTEDRLIATTEKPLAKVGEFAYLKVKSTDKFGAFLDWGLTKDLLVPFREQKADMIEGYSYIVYIYLDEKTKRLAASAKTDKFLSKEIADYPINSEVKILITGQTDLGYKTIVENKYQGLLYNNEVFINIQRGDRLSAFVKKVRDDGKIDLSLQKAGYSPDNIQEISQRIIETLIQNKGFVAAGDKSTPEMINALFGISKKTFKKVVGSLYKQKLITIENDGIRLVKA